MKKYMKLIVLISIIFMLNACSKTPTKSKPTELSSEEIYKLAWQYYQIHDYSKAKENFEVLAEKQDAYLEGYLGLGWTHLKLNQALNSKLNFNKFFDLDSLDVIVITDSSFIDGKAGLSFVSLLLNDFNSALTNSASINSTWISRFDENLNYQDIVLLRAIAYYALTQYTQSLDMVKILDPEFTVDLSFLEGRIALAQKIETLKLELD